MKIFDNTLTRLERSLDVRLARHNVLAGDLANVDTPGFVPKDVDFATAMANAEARENRDTGSAPALAGTDGAAVSVGLSTGRTDDDIPVVDVGGDSPGIDGNLVDLDRTMAALAENGLQYAAGARAAGKKLAILRYVASDGNG